MHPLRHAALLVLGPHRLARLIARWADPAPTSRWALAGSAECGVCGAHLQCSRSAYECPDGHVRVRRRELDTWVDDNADVHVQALLGFELKGFCRGPDHIDPDLASARRDLEHGAHGYCTGTITTVQFGQFAKACLGEIAGLERELENSRAGARLILPRRWSSLPTGDRRDLLRRHVRIRVAANGAAVIHVVSRLSDR